MSSTTTVRIFISSPADVRPERLLAQRIIARLDREFAYHFHVEAILWEREPLVASRHFQDPRNIPPPSSSDVVVVILWSRLGVPLPEAEFRGAISGRPVTGTEWEFEEALAAARRHDGIPHLLVYRKREPVTASLEDDVALEAQRQQKRELEEFVGRWFGSAADHDITAASHTFMTTQEFEEMLYEHLAALLERRAGSVEHTAIRWHEPPFRGLHSFDLEHAPIFFGRTQARNELRQLLAREIALGARPFVVVSGPSGSGKSSLVKAGLLPDLMLPGMLGRVALCRYAVLRPSDAEGRPLHALASAVISDTALPELRALHYDVARIESVLRGGPEVVSLPVEQGLAEAAKAGNLVESADARLVLIVDQFEELFTTDSIDERQRREFVAALDALSRTGLVWVIATLRGDFVDRLSQFPELAGSANSNAHYFVSAPTDSEFAQIIRQPAREAGLRFEFNAVDGSSLDEIVREAATKDPNVLPLLSFLLDELWRNRNANGELTFEAYHRLGGLEGALAKRAEGVFTAQPSGAQSALPRVLRALVNVETGAHVAARTAPLDQFAQDSPERSLIDAFSSPAARLFVVGGDRERSTVRVAHEALLTQWDRAAKCLAEDRTDLELRARLGRDAARWSSMKNSGESLLLPSGLPLEEARDLLVRRRDELDDQIVEYVAASWEADRRRRRARRNLVGASFIVLLLLSGFALVQWRNAASQRYDALVAQSRFLARDSRSATDRGDATLGTLVALAALPARVGQPDRPVVADAEYALEDAMGNLQERRVLRGHEDSVNAASFSPDGTRIVSGSWDETVRVWDATSGAQLAVLRGHEGVVSSAQFSPDGRRIASASWDGTIRVWDAGSGALLVVLRGHGGVVRSAAFSPDGRRIVSASDDRTVRIWDSRTGRPIAVLRGGGAVNSAAFSPDGSRIVSGSDDKSVRLWDAVSGAPIAVLRGHEAAVSSVAFSPDGRRVVSASEDRTVRLWDARNAMQIAVLRGHDDIVNSVAFSSDGRHIVSASADKTVRIWEATRHTQLAVLRGHDDAVSSAAFSQDGRHIVSASADRTVRVWDASTAAQAAVLRGHRGIVRSAAFSPDGRRIVSASWDATVRVWDATTGAQLAVLRGHRDHVNSASFSPDGRRIVSASDDATVRVWDAADGATIFVLRGGDDPVYSTSFSPDGRRILGASETVVRLWDAASGRQITVLQGVAEGINSASFSPDSRRIATACTDGTVVLWDVTSGKQTTVLRHENWMDDAAFSPDGRRIAGASNDGVVQVWDATSGAAIFAMPGNGAEVNSVAYSPDGQRIVGAYSDNTVQMWDAASGAQIAALRGHDAALSTAAFSPDSLRIVTGSNDQTVRVWNVPRDQALVDAARSRLPRQLTGAQRAAEFLSSEPPSASAPRGTAGSEPAHH